MLYSFFWVTPGRLNFMCRLFGTECSETSAHKVQTPGNYPEEKYKIQNRLKFEIKCTSNVGKVKGKPIPVTGLDRP